MDKHAVAPYEPLIAFANEDITPDNWEAVLGACVSHPPVESKPQNQTWEVWVRSWEKKPDPYSRLRNSYPHRLGNQEITGPQLVLKGQSELREILDRLTDPMKDIVPVAPETRTPELLHAFPETVLEPRKDLSWLAERINGASIGERPTQSFATAKVKAPMWIDVYHYNPCDRRVLLSDPVRFVPIVEDLQEWIYYCLGCLWADGLLPRTGRCQNPKCQRFFLAKTDREDRRYCSQRCAQRVTAAERVKATRARRAAWTDARKNLERAVENMRTLRKITEKQALERGENALKKAESAFTAAYPRKKGPGYEEGEKLLAQAKEYVKRSRKKVKGY